MRTHYSDDGHFPAGVRFDYELQRFRGIRCILAVALDIDGQSLLGLITQRDTLQHVAELNDLLVLDAHDAVTRFDTLLPSGPARYHGTDHGLDPNNAHLESHGGHDHGEDQVHDHAGGDDRHAPRDALGQIAAGVEERFFGRFDVGLADQRLFARR